MVNSRLHENLVVQYAVKLNVVEHDLAELL